jgi:hypothetical protein
VAPATASLYARISGSILLGVPWVKQNAPRPISPALVKVGGLPAATHMAGWLAPKGLGNTSRSGMRKYFPS